MHQVFNLQSILVALRVQCPFKIAFKMLNNSKLTRCLALDCEMVGIGRNWHQDMLGRVSIVNEDLECVYDKFVKPTETVTDYRTRVSGIRKADLDNGTDFVTVQQEVQDMLRGRILVGHGLENDFAVLKITHPQDDVRDTGFYYENLFNTRTPALKWLAQKFLNKTIQAGAHSSVEDAKTTMRLYKLFKVKWERSLGNAI